MANTLTDLIPDLFAALDQVSRELVGYIPAVGRNSSAERAAVGQEVRYHVAPSANVSDVTPAMQVPEPTDQSIGSDTITITKSRAAEFGYVGEEQRGLNQNGPGYLSVQADQIAQALRSLVNEIETDTASAATAAASRAFGDPTEALFQTNTAAVSQGRKILVDNGAPTSELQLILNTAAGANLRTLYGINTDRDWSDMPLREQGVLVTPHGLAVRETGQPQSHTGGTASSATTDDSGYAVGATTITLAVAGTGAIEVGDVITFAGDSEQYVVTAGEDDVSDGGSITIQEPGLQQAIPAAATDITVVGDYDANVAFHRGAIQLATRAPALPQEGDLALDRMTITDPRSGLAFEASIYGGYRKVRYEVAMAWGVKVVQPRHTALVIGDPASA